MLSTTDNAVSGVGHACSKLTRMHRASQLVFVARERRYALCAEAVELHAPFAQGIETYCTNNSTGTLFSGGEGRDEAPMR